MRGLNPTLLTAALVVTAVAPASAQQTESKPTVVRPASATATRTEEPKLIFEREIFTYPAENRRDPFKPIGQDVIGPLFEDLSLRMIIFSEVPNQSVVVVADRAKKTYRLRRGETIGNAMVTQITSTRVVFTVDDYGNRRQETLDLRPNQETEGA